MSEGVSFDQTSGHNVSIKLARQTTFNRYHQEGARELMKTMGGGVGNDSPYHTIQPSGPGPVCLPFRTYNSFVLHVMFPSSHPGYESFRQKLMGGTGNTLSSSYRLNQSGGSSATMERNGQMISFLKMLGQKEFMHVLVRTLEKQPSFTMNDRNNVAAFIMIALQDRLDYGTVILQYLMVDMIENSRPDQLNTLMRQSTSICEKMLSFWFTMLMHRTLFERTGNYLYQLFTAVRHITYSGAGEYCVNKFQIVKLWSGDCLSEGFTEKPLKHAAPAVLLE